MKETKTMWAAYLDYDNKVIVGEVVVTWTKAQYQIVKTASHPKMGMAYGFASVVNKRTNTCLFYTEKEALEALHGRYQERYADTTRMMLKAHTAWSAVALALEKLCSSNEQ